MYSYVTVRCSQMVKDTPKIHANAFVSKSGRKGCSIMILPDTGGTITLIHSKIVRRLGLKVNMKEKEEFDLYNAQEASMVVEGTSIVNVVPKICEKARP